MQSIGGLIRDWYLVMRRLCSCRYALKFRLLLLWIVWIRMYLPFILVWKQFHLFFALFIVAIRNRRILFQGMYATEKDLLITNLFGNQSRNMQAAGLNLNFANGTRARLRESKVDGLRSRGGKRAEGCALLRGH